MCLQSARLTAWKHRDGGSGCWMAACKLADDLVTGQRKTLVVLSIVVVTVLGALTGLMIGFTLLEQISLHGGTALSTQQLGSLAALGALLLASCKVNSVGLNHGRDDMPSTLCSESVVV